MRFRIRKKDGFALTQVTILSFALIAIFSVLASSAPIVATPTSYPSENFEESPRFRVLADENETQGDESFLANKGGIAIGAGMAIGLAGLGAALGMGSAGSAASAAITERPEQFVKTLIFLVLIEAIAIYGFVIAFLLIQTM